MLELDTAPWMILKGNLSKIWSPRRLPFDQGEEEAQNGRIIFPYLHNLETKQDIADYFDSTLAASTAPATPYTIHHKSGLDDEGQ